MIPTSEADIWQYLMLRNAIVQQAVYDFEALISEGPIPESAMACSSEMTVPAIRQFAKGTDADVWLDKIEKTYYEKFRPYAHSHADEIVRDWKKHMRIKDETARRNDLKKYKHRCPMCGGVMKPITSCGVKLIGCNFCYLNIRLPVKKKEAKK